jgi:hypothetical protein
VLMVIRLVRKEVPQMSDRSSDDPSFGRAFTPAVFSRPGKYVKYRTRARLSRTHQNGYSWCNHPSHGGTAYMGRTLIRRS